MTPSSSAPARLAPFAFLSASYFAHVGFFNPYLPLWLKQQGHGLAAITFFVAIQSATRFFAPYTWGWIADRSGERVRLLRIAATVALVCSAGLLWNGGVVWLAVVMVLMFSHTSSMMSMSEAAMAQLVSRDGGFHAGRYGRVRLWGSLGFLGAVFFAGAWFERFGIGHFPAWVIATLALLCLASWRLPELHEPVVAHHDPLPLGDVLGRPVVRWYFLSMFFQVLAHMSLYFYLSLYLHELGFGETAIGLIWALSVIVEVTWFYVQDRCIDLLSPAQWALVAAVAMVVRMGVMPLGGVAGVGLALLLFAQVLHALTFAAHHTTFMAMLAREFPVKLRGRGQALYTTIGYGFTGVLGGWAGGLITARWGLTAVFWVSAGVAAVAVACAWRLMRVDADRAAGAPA